MGIYMKTTTSAIALTVALSTFLVNSANAADLGRGPVTDPTSVGSEQPPAGWTGPWIGVVGGLTFFNTELDYLKDHIRDDVRTNAQHLNIDGLGAEGLFGEVQAGYDHQVTNNVLIGVFAGANLSDAEFTASQSYYGEQFASVTTDYEWGGVVGARLGLVKSPNTLFYVAGGYAYAQLGDTNIAFGDETESLSGPELHGWFGEVGMEHRLSQSISLTVAGRYTDYGSETLWSNAGTRQAEFCPEEVDIDVDNLAVMVGIKARLNGGFGF